MGSRLDPACSEEVGAVELVGVSSRLVLWRDTNRSPTGSLAVPSWWRVGVDLGLASLARFERLPRQIQGAVAGAFLLASRGGGGEGANASVPFRFALSLVVRVSGGSCRTSSPPSSGGNGLRPARGCLLEVRWWIMFSLSAIAAGVGNELKRQAAVAGICGHFLSDCTCNLCKPSDLIIGHCGCDSDPWQWQVTTERNTYRSVLANDHFLMMLNASMFGFFTTIWTPTCIVNHMRRTRSQCLLKTKEMVLNSLKSSHYTLMYFQAADHSVFAFFGPLGCIRRRQLRESLMSLPRFGGKDFFDLSSVICPQDLQLNPKPHSCLPMRLLVEPLALRLVRFQEAPGEHNCKFFLSEVSSDPLAGSNCVLPHRQCDFSVRPLVSVCLVGLFISDSQSSSCMSYVVIVCYF
jgi:hypothetical protein